MRAKLKAIKQELRQRMHQSIPVQGKWLWQVVKGYFNFHAVPTNSRAACSVTVSQSSGGACSSTAAIKRK
jgi:hypothetical protein